MTDPIRVIIDKQQLDEIRDLIYSTRDGADTAVYRALNYGSNQARKKAVDMIYAKAALTKTKIRAKTFVYLASISKLQSQITIKNDLVGLEQYGANQTNTGVTFRIWRDGSREKYRHAFIATLPGAKNPGVYERNIEHGDYDGRLPLRRKYGPTIAALYENTPGIDSAVQETASSKMLFELDRQIKLLMGI